MIGNAAVAEYGNVEVEFEGERDSSIVDPNIFSL